ncbi:alpha/beta fold hydrolase [Salininema proteolyticum]|uniref:Alpha/beta fold hydrolase n=1 Tax=Salininema proteolyticum TaxID=1607685 RepID=A0ABV8TZT5_9ACTN
MLTATRRSAIPDAPSTTAHSHGGFHYESLRAPATSSPTTAPVVLIGGAFQRKEDWGRILKGLANHADVIAVDLPGWGGADLLPSQYGIDFLTDACIRALDDHLESAGLHGGTTGRFNLMAGSYGTAVGYRLAQRRPDLVERAVMIGTMRSIPDHLRDVIEEGIAHILAGRRREFATTAVEWMTTRRPGADVERLAVIRRILWGKLANIPDDEVAKFVANTRRLFDLDSMDTGRGPSMPMLFGVGEHDTFTPPELCWELAQTCPSSQFVQIRRSDHLVHLERPNDIVDLAVRFFHRLPVGEAPYLLGADDTV